MITRYNICLSALFLFIISINVNTSANPSLKEIRNLFEWGDYDSLIVKLDPIISNPLGEDSFYVGECHKFIGVAYFAKGRIGDARGEFAKSFEYNNKIAIDSFYISRQIYDLFADAIQESKEQKEHLFKTDLLIREKERAIHDTSMVLQKIKSTGQIRNNVLVSSVFYGLSLISGGVALYSFKSAESDYNRFEAASQKGDRLIYDKMRTDIRYKDAVQVASIITGILFTVPGTYFLKKALRTQKVAIGFLNDGSGQITYTAGIFIAY